MKNESKNQSPMFDVAVVGGGLAGLAAATYAARAGLTVILLERAPQPGGRATTQNEHGYQFNQGPHALYRLGEGIEVLRELGVSYSGARASADGSWVIRNGEKHPLPRTSESFKASKFLSEGGKVEAMTLFGELMNQFDTASWNRTSLREWLDTQIHNEEVRALFEGLLRLSTYCNDSTLQSAGAALDQLIVGSDGVDYLDGGWQSLVNSLRDTALAAGTRIETRGAVEVIRCDGETATICLVNGSVYSARTVIATLSPSMLARLVNNGNVASLGEWAEQATPIYAACLDVALTRLPVPENQFAIGLDSPLYYSVHTRSAKLAPDGGVVIQLAKYLQSNVENDAVATGHELEALLDSLQPGWRDHLVAKRFLPRMLVTNAVVTAAQGGTAGRPGPGVPEIPNLFVAGDWVGPHGMLADTSLASARDAARSAARLLGTVNETGGQSRAVATVA